MSESRDFPVAPGMTSHEACLAAIRDATVFVLLIGQRFGGEFAKQNKSITWREWEEAQGAGLLVVSLIEQRANSIARKIFIERKTLEKRYPKAKTANLDARLLRKFPDYPPLVHKLPGVQRFIDEVRKGHKENWVHTDWTGTAYDAMRIFDRRCGAALASYHVRETGVRDLANRQTNRLLAFARASSWAALLSADVRAGRKNSWEAQELLLKFVEDRPDLLGFRDGDRYNLMIYFRRGNTLRPGPRVHHPKIRVRNRSWSMGQGHVGLAAKSNALMVSGDMRHTDAWPRSSTRSDKENYVSCISVPLYFAGNAAEPDGVFVVTSNRLDQFATTDSEEVLTAEILGRMITTIGLS
jgi:hypothetical protein